MLLNRKFKTLVTVTLIGVAPSCFQSREQKEEPSPFVGQTGKTGSSTGTAKSGSTQKIDPFDNKSAGSGAATGGSTQSQQDDGRSYVNGWNGIEDELPAGSKWLVGSVAIVSVDAHGVIIGQVNPPSNQATPSPTPAAEASRGALPQTPIANAVPQAGGQLPQPGLGAPTNDQVQETADAVTFIIKPGTGQNAWNTPQTEVVAKVGKRFVIVNQDSITHQWHTNGSPCPHGNPIRPGGQAECRPNQPYSGPPLYDHITRGQFFIKAVQ